MIIWILFKERKEKNKNERSRHNKSKTQAHMIAETFSVLIMIWNWMKKEQLLKEIAVDFNNNKVKQHKIHLDVVKGDLTVYCSTVLRRRVQPIALTMVDHQNHFCHFKEETMLEYLNLRVHQRKCNSNYVLKII